MRCDPDKPFHNQASVTVSLGVLKPRLQPYIQPRRKEKLRTEEWVYSTRDTDNRLLHKKVIISRNHDTETASHSIRPPLSRKQQESHNPPSKLHSYCGFTCIPPCCWYPSVTSPLALDTTSLSFCTVAQHGHQYETQQSLVDDPLIPNFSRT